MNGLELAGRAVVQLRRDRRVRCVPVAAESQAQLKKRILMLEDEEFWALRRLDAIEALRQIAIEFPDLVEGIIACGSRASRLCPHCGSGRWTLLNGTAHRKGLMQCNDCRGQFTETTKTIRHRTRLSPDVWQRATDMVQASPWVPAKTLQRELGLGSYKTAWQLKRDVLAELMPA